MIRWICHGFYRCVDRHRLCRADAVPPGLRNLHRPHFMAGQAGAGNHLARETFTLGNAAHMKRKNDKLVRKIRENQCKSAWLVLDEYGEENFLSVDIDNGWAARAFNTYSEDGEARMYQPVNPEYDTTEENAPVHIGGQTPVLKRNALNDLKLVAECVLHFAKIGELYPELKREEVE